MTDIQPFSEEKVTAAFERVRKATGANVLDRDYLVGHELRHRRTIHRIGRLVPRGARILDIGSHYLHQAAMLAVLGYEVIGIDVPEFADSRPILERAAAFGIRNFSVPCMGQGEFLPGMEDSIDCVNCCEVLEHISFNPVRFWRRIYDVIKIGGTIYLTTPNSMKPWQIGSIVKRALLFQGYGISIESILGGVTYGHHWKDYSAREIRQLFELLSPDFIVEVRTFRYRSEETRTDLKSLMRQYVRNFAANFPSLGRSWKLQLSFLDVPHGAPKFQSAYRYRALPLGNPL